jgi:hypothetical protein
LLTDTPFFLHPHDLPFRFVSTSLIIVLRKPHQENLMTNRTAVLAVLTLLCAAPAAAQQNEKASADKGTPLAGTSAYLDALRQNTTTAGRVALAEAAGPTAIARHATIVEFTPTMESKVLRAGTNGWTCVADPRGPMCADATFMAFMCAMMSKLPPKIDRVGVGFMLVGDEGVSLTDPFAQNAADKVKSGAHTMIIVPNAADLAGLADNPSAGGAYVMWKGTPYAHVMLPSR